MDAVSTTLLVSVLFCGCCGEAGDDKKEKPLLGVSDDDCGGGGGGSVVAEEAEEDVVNPANMDGCVSARGFNATDDDVSSSCPSFPTLLVLLLLLGSPDMKLNADGAAVGWDGGSAGVVVELLAATVLSVVAGVDGDGEDVDEPMDDCKNEKPLELAAGEGEGEDFSSPSPFIDRPPNMADVVLLLRLTSVVDRVC